MRRWQEPVVAACAALIILACAVLPLGVLAAEGLSSGSFDVLARAAPWRLFAGTVLTSLAVTAAALAIGVPLGFAIARCDIVGRRAVLLVHALPMFVPPFLLALGWFHLLGHDGLIGGELTSRWLFARPGLVLVLALAFAPIVTALTALAVDGIDPALEDAARVASSPWRVATRVLLPIAGPSIALAGLIVFALAFSELGVPMFLRVSAYPAAVFARLGGIDYAPGEAFVLVLPQLAVAVALLAIERRWIARRRSDLLGVRRGARPLLLRHRAAASAACWVVASIGIAPLAALACRARWRDVWMWAGDSVRHSVGDAAVAATIMVICGIVIGRALARRQRWARVLDGVMLFALVTPAAALGAGLIATWSRPSTQFVYSTSAIVVIGYIARYAIICARPIAASVARSNVLEEAARVGGAHYLRRLVRIVTPLHARAIAAAWLLGLVFCLRDLESVVLYYPPGMETLPVRIFTLEANGPPGTVAALATLHVAITMAVLALGLLALRRRPQ
jgi:iron(III) transport system permease protein